MKITKIMLEELIREELDNVSEKYNIGNERRDAPGPPTEQEVDALDYDFGKMGDDFKKRALKELRQAFVLVRHAGMSSSRIGSQGDAVPGRGRDYPEYPMPDENRKQMSDELGKARRAIQRLIELVSSIK